MLHRFPSSPTVRPAPPRFLEYEYELLNHLRLWETTSKHTLELITAPKEEQAMPLTCVAWHCQSQKVDDLDMINAIQVRILVIVHQEELESA